MPGKRPKLVEQLEFEGDPELPDEHDPEFKEEMFETHFAMGTKPESLHPKQYQDEYREWLANGRRNLGESASAASSESPVGSRCAEQMKTKSIK